MDEQNKTQETPSKEKISTDDTDNGNNPSALPVIEQIRAERERLDESTQKAKEENDRRERLLAEERLGGRTEAGYEERKKELTPKEYASEIMSGNKKILENGK